MARLEGASFQSKIQQAYKTQRLKPILFCRHNGIAEAMP